MATLQEQYIDALTFLGYKRIVNSRTRRIVFESPHRPGTYWYLGKAGAIRIGKTIADSHPAGPTTKRYLLTAKALREQVRTALAGRQIDDNPNAIYAAASRLSLTIPEDIRILIMHVRALVREGAQSGDQD